MLKIIGSSHIAKQSINQVRRAIKKEKPDIVALELDKRRLVALMQDKKRISIFDMGQVGFKGFLFAWIGSYIERKLGQIVKVSPGAEMLEAFKLAQKNNIKVALIDQDIRITLRNISKYFTWKERFHLVSDILKGIFFRRREIERVGIKDLDLTKVPPKKLIKKMIAEFKLKYPVLYKILVEDRNRFMAKNLKKIMKRYPNEKILAIVGAGHEEEILRLAT